MYYEIYPCIFQSKSKFPADHRIIYQLLSTIRLRKKENILKFAATEESYATLDPKNCLACHQGLSLLHL